MRGGRLTVYRRAPAMVPAPPPTEARWTRVRRKHRWPPLGFAAASVAAHLLVAAAWHAPLLPKVPRPQAPATQAWFTVAVEAGTWEAAYCSERQAFPYPSSTYACFDRTRAERHAPTCGFERWAEGEIDPRAWSLGLEPGTRVVHRL